MGASDEREPYNLQAAMTADTQRTVFCERARAAASKF